VEVEGATINSEKMQYLWNWQVSPQFHKPNGVSTRFDYSNLYLDLVWVSSLNNKASSAFTIFVGTNYDNSPIEKATVTIDDQTAVTDRQGIARFKPLPLGDYPIYIKSTNSLDNQAGVPGGSGSFDVDLKNDTFRVTEMATSAAFIIAPMDVDIKLTLTVYRNPFMR
jgi:hypothetical protein